MKITGIVAEFNPFHSGHEFLIKKALQETSSDACIVVMSGDFVQRGAPAFINKYLRAEAALNSGCSMVIELNQQSATGSAPEFAEGAIRLLNSLGVIDTLAFGSESGDIAALGPVCDILSEEPASYKESLKQCLASGLSFPAARAAALNACAGIDPAILKGSNNILALEYMRMLKLTKSRIVPFTIKREGEAYNSGSISASSFSSAKAIREAVINNAPELPLSAMPEHAASILVDSIAKKAFLTADDLSSELLYALRMNLPELEDFYDLVPELADRIRNTIDEYKSFSQYTELLKTKNMTYTAISRSLIHVLLGIRRDKNCAISDFLSPQYIRVLGFRKDSSKLLKLIAENSSVPLIIRPTEAAEKLSKKALRSFNEEIRSANIYESVISRRSGLSFSSEFRRRMLTL
ncbi:MAG: nucleotidyltransferase family protein [Lachnospiraceae bacterium]|nr:nucleotidyltransferase family protein [Lachnospiraceae bacterium]